MPDTPKEHRDYTGAVVVRCYEDRSRDVGRVIAHMHDDTCDTFTFRFGPDAEDEQTVVIGKRHWLHMRDSHEPYVEFERIRGMRAERHEHAPSDDHGLYQLFLKEQADPAR